MTASRDWGGLRGILDQATEDRDRERATPPVACPVDGEPLVESNGTLRCPWGNYWWHGGQTL